jgi:hypothetical protein
VSDTQLVFAIKTRNATGGREGEREGMQRAFSRRQKELFNIRSPQGNAMNTRRQHRTPVSTASIKQ